MKKSKPRGIDRKREKEKVMFANSLHPSSELHNITRSRALTVPCTGLVQYPLCAIAIAHPERGERPEGRSLVRSIRSQDGVSSTKLVYCLTGAEITKVQLQISVHLIYQTSSNMLTA